MEEESCSVMAVGVLVSAGTFSGLLELKWVSVGVIKRRLFTLSRCLRSFLAKKGDF